MKCLIIEDEAPAQRILQRYIADIPHLELVSTENNALSGMAQLDQQSIDLLFLDINLPKLSGLEFLRALRSPPKVILTTAYPEYALESYELNVVDYLLKPFSFSRFLQAIRKAQAPQLQPANDACPDHFFVKADKVVYRIQANDLLFCKAEGDFVRVVLKDRTLMVGDTLQHFEQLLSSFGILRVHRSYLLRLDALDKLQGRLAYTARGEVPIGRTYREQLLRQLQ